MRIPCNWASLLVISLSILPRVQAQPRTLEVGGNSSTAKLDADSEPLPPGARFRLGTRNWRHRGEGFSICYSPDSKKIAFTSRYSDVFVMNAKTGQREFAGKLKLKDGSRLKAKAIAFSPNGQELAARSPGRSVELFSVEGRKHLRSQVVKLDFDFGISDGRSLIYSQDGKYLAVGTGFGYAVLDAKTGDIVITENTKAQIQGLAFDAKSTQLFVASLKPSVKIWDLAKREIVKTWSDSDDHFVRGPAIAPNKTTIAVGTQEVLVVDLTADKVVHRLKGDDPKELFMELAISPDGQLVIGASQEGTVYVWNLADGTRKWKLSSNSWVVRNMAISPDGRSVATSDALNHIWVWSLETGELLSGGGPGHDMSVDEVAFSHDGTLLVTGSGQQDTHIWNAATGAHLRKLKTSSSSIAFTLEGNLVTSWANSPQLKVWKASTGDLLSEATPSGPTSGDFAVSGDGKRLVTLERISEPPGCRMLMLEYPSLKPLREIKGDGYHEGCIALSHNGELAAVAAQEIIEIWNLREGVLAARMSGHKHHPQGLAFTPDGRFLISGSLDQTVRVWEMASCKQVFELQGHKRSVAAIALSPNGRIVASAGGSQSYPIDVEDPHQIRLWDIATGEQVATLSGHNEDVSSLAFSPDGKLLASGMYDTTALVWEVPAAAQVRGFRQQPLMEGEAAKFWKDLASADANQGHKALLRLVQNDKAAIGMAEKELKPTVAPPAKEIHGLIQELDSDSFEKREASMAKLMAYGDIIANYLKEAVEKSESAEVKMRCRQILAQAARTLEQSPPTLAQTRSVQLLEWSGTPQAISLLKTLAGGADDAHQTREAKAALVRLKK